MNGKKVTFAVRCCVAFASVSNCIGFGLADEMNRRRAMRSEKVDADDYKCFTQARFQRWVVRHRTACGGAGRAAEADQFPNFEARLEIAAATAKCDKTSDAACDRRADICYGNTAIRTSALQNTPAMAL